MMNVGKVEECNVCFFLLRLSQPLDKNEQQALFSNSDYIDHDDHRGDDDDYIHMMVALAMMKRHVRDDMGLPNLSHA